MSFSFLIALYWLGVISSYFLKRRKKVLREPNPQSETISLDDLKGKGGIVAWLTNDYYYRIIVENKEDKTLVSSSLRVHGFEAIKDSISLDKTNGSLELSITTTPDSYSFYVGNINLGSASYAALCPEGAMYMTFTGTMLGIWSEEGMCSFLEGLSIEGQAK